MRIALYSARCCTAPCRWLRVLCVVTTVYFALLLVGTAHSAPPKTIELKLKKGEVIKLDAIDIKAEYEEEKRRGLRKSIIHSVERGELIDLYSYIVSLPSVMDAVTFNGIYNLNLRGINTSPLNFILPFDVVIDGISFADAYRTPHHAYLLPRIGFFSGVDAFNDLSSGSQGVVSVTTSQPNREHKATAVGEIDTLTQTGYGQISGPIKNGGFYGLHLNAFNRPGRYQNRFLSSTADRANNTRIDETFDDENGQYANGYLIFSLSDSLELRLYTIYNNQNRGFAHGYQTTYDNFDIVLDPSEYQELANSSELLTTTPASADVVGAINQSENITFGVDGSYYLRESILEFGINAQNDATTKRLHIGSSNDNVSQIAATYQENEKITSNRFEFVLRFKPISIEYAKYRFGFNLRLENSTTDFANTTIASNPMSTGDSVIVLDHSHDTQTAYAQIYGDYNLELGSVRIDGGGLFVGYESTLTQRGRITENDISGTTIGLLEGINNRLDELGIDTRYTAGDITGDTEFTNQALLPKLTIEWQTYPFDSQINYFIKYYQGYIPGGLNPYAVSDEGRRDNEYEAQINTTAELGFNWFEDTFVASLTAFSIEMENVHYLDSLNGFERYYGNAKKAISTGGELWIDYSPASNWNFNFLVSAISASYDDFTHTAYNSPTQSIVLDYTGNTVPLSPETAARIGMSYITYYGLYMHLGVTHFGAHYFDNANLLKSDGYALLNAEIGWENEHWAIALYGKNLSNEEYTESALVNPYNSTGTALATEVNNANNGTVFRWQDTVVKTIGQPLSVGLLISARY